MTVVSDCAWASGRFQTLRLCPTVLLVALGDVTSFPTAAHLSSYAGLSPTTKSSGTSVHGEYAPSGLPACRGRHLCGQHP
ncbi:hypothetical protein SUDANB23_06575 (plasmid) [Streptomyces sp. enrichment culture]